MARFERDLQAFLLIISLISFVGLSLVANPDYLQKDLPDIVLSKDEIFSLNLNDYFQINSPILKIPNLSFKSPIDWQIKPQYNSINDFPINFTFLKALPISSSPFIIFLSSNALYLYEFINSKSTPILLQSLLFGDFIGNLSCFDATLLDSFLLIVDCNIKKPLGFESIFLLVDIGDFMTNTMKIKSSIQYNVELYLDYMLNCQRKFYSYGNRILQYCQYFTLMELKDSCFSREKCSNHIILWEINENKVNFLLILDEFSLNIEPQFLPLKIQKVLIYWKTDTLMLLELHKGVYQYNFSNLQLKQEKSIEFNDENDTIYLGMELDKVSHRMPFIEMRHFLIVCNNKYCVEVLMKDSYEFYFAKRYDYHYFIENYLSDKTEVLFQDDVKAENPSNFTISLQDTQINNNFINLVLDLQEFDCPIKHYQLIFSRKQDRVAIHYMRRLRNETNFIRINFLYDEGDYFLELMSNKNFLRLIEITDLYLLLHCCPMALNKGIYPLSIPLQITTQANPEDFYESKLVLTLIPLNYPHVLPATNQMKFQFEDPIIYIKLANIAIGPEIEFIYLSGNNDNFRLTIDHIHQIPLDLNEITIEKLLKYELIASWIDNDNLSLRMVFKYIDITPLGTFYRFMGLECRDISNNYLGDCNILTKYEPIFLINPVDFYLEKTNSMIYLHENNADHIKLVNLSQNLTFALLLTPTKPYSIVIFSPPNLIFGIPCRNNSIEVYYILSENLQISHQTEKILNIDAHYLGLSFELNILQIDLTLITEGIIIIVSSISESSSNLIVLQMVQSEYITPRFIVRLASIKTIDSCEILVLNVKKIILVCSDSITEMQLNNPFDVDKIRNYPLYRYNLNIERKPFTDDKLLYVFATYYSVITLNIQPVLLVYDPSKTAASLLVTTINMASVVSMVQCLQVKTELSLLMMNCLGDYVLNKNKLKEKAAGIFLNMITLQPALTGVFRFKEDEKAQNKKQNEKTFEINVSFTNENSNMDLVSTLHINMNLKDYNIFLSNSSLQNNSIIVTFSRKSRKHTFIDSNFFKGPIEDYEISNNKNNSFVMSLKDYLTEGTVMADYQESINNYGLVLDMISTDEFIIVLSQYKLIIYKMNDFPAIFYQETLQFKYDQCKLAHHPKEMIFLLSCFNSFDLILYKYTPDKTINKTIIKIPYYVGLISTLVPIYNYIFIKTRFFNSLNETEFRICEFPNFNTSTLRVIGIINSEDFELMNIKCLDFELLEIFFNQTLMKFGIFIVQTFQIMYMEIEISDNKITNKSLFSMASNPFPAFFTSFTIDKLLISPNATSSYYKMVGLIGTDEHLYELELEFDPYKREIRFGEPLFVYRKYCKCQNLAAKPIKYQDYVARVCSYNLKETDLTIDLFKEESKDLYHFIQIYKKVNNEQEAHPIRVIKVLYSPEISKIFLFYRSSYPQTDSLHLLTASYLNYLIDYDINQWMSLGIYFLKNNEKLLTQTQELKIVATNDFSTQDINITVIIEGDEEEGKNFDCLMVEWIAAIAVIAGMGLGVAIYIFWKHRKKKMEELKVREETTMLAPKSRRGIMNNIELGYVD